MCLIKTHRFPKISTKQITVYKLLYLYNSKNKEYFTPYKRVKVNMGETIKAKKSWLRGIFKEDIEGEGVHAYLTLEKALMNKFLMDGNFIIVVEAIIPSFTPYWIGFEGEIAASKIKIAEELK